MDLNKYDNENTNNNTFNNMNNQNNVTNDMNNQNIPSNNTDMMNNPNNINNNGYNNSSYYNPYYKSQQPNGKAIASLVLGILSIVFSPCQGITLILGIIGLILGICSKKGELKLHGMAIAGIICSSIGIFFGLISLLFFIGIFNALNKHSNSYDYSHRNHVYEYYFISMLKNFIRL